MQMRFSRRIVYGRLPNLQSSESAVRADGIRRHLWNRVRVRHNEILMLNLTTLKLGEFFDCQKSMWRTCVFPNTLCCLPSFRTEKISTFCSLIHSGLPCTTSACTATNNDDNYSTILTYLQRWDYHIIELHIPLPSLVRTRPDRMCVCVGFPGEVFGF